MLQAGTSVSTKGRSRISTDNKEIQYLADICDILRNEGGILTEILNASGGVSTYNTINHYNVTSGTRTITASTAHSISFSVISGTVTVSFDGGSTSITYPVGYNGNLEASTTIANSIIFTAATGSDRVIVQTLTA